MKTALVTTTINIPSVLSVYRACAPHVEFFVACDLKTPIDLPFISNCHFVSPAEQSSYKSSDFIGWNNDSRRNFAILESLRWGADLIISIDDDMIPLDHTFFYQFDRPFVHNFTGLQAGSPQKWLDHAGRARGLPLEGVQFDSGFHSGVTHARVGAAQGIILGRPDCDALAATLDSVTTSVGPTGLSGHVAHPLARAVFNSQLTAFRREVAPAMGQFYNYQGRNTDIFASLVARRVMREFNFYTHYGPPIAWHARSLRPVLPDLKSELWGIERVAAFAEWLDFDFVGRGSTKHIAGAAHYSAFRFCNYVRDIYSNIPSTFGEAGFKEAALAWLDDVEIVL